MSKVGKLVENVYYFDCPGCECSHHIDIRVWSFNLDFEKPTIRASILVNRGSTDPENPVCHSFVTDGEIQFLPDSTHKLSGQTVELPDLEN